MVPLAQRKQSLEDNLDSETLILVPSLSPFPVPVSLPVLFVFLLFFFYILIPHPVNPLRNPEGFPLKFRSGTMSASRKILKS